VRRARLATLAVTTLVAVGLFGVVSAHAVLTQGQLQLEQLSARAAEAEARFQRLRLQVAELESPQRIVAVAQQRLGMVPPPGVTYLSPTGATAGELARSTPRATPKPATGPDHGAWGAVKAQLDGRP
jgi:cell division protein FtsL